MPEDLRGLRGSLLLSGPNLFCRARPVSALWTSKRSSLSIVVCVPCVYWRQMQRCELLCLLLVPVNTLLHSSNITWRGPDWKAAVFSEIFLNGLFISRKWCSFIDVEKSFKSIFKGKNNVWHCEKRNYLLVLTGKRQEDWSRFHICPFNMNLMAAAWWAYLRLHCVTLYTWLLFDIFAMCPHTGETFGKSCWPSFGWKGLEWHRAERGSVWKWWCSHPRSLPDWILIS